MAQGQGNSLFGQPSGQGGQGGQGGLGGLLSQYEVPLPDIAQAYMRSFNRGGPIDVPSFQELYGSYRDVAQRETNRQAASLNEAYGSQGARYGSDILGAQGRLRENMGGDLALYSGNLLQNLRGQQFQEASALGNLQYGIEEAGMARLYQDFLRRTSPPPLLGAATSYGPSIQGPTNVVY